MILLCLVILLRLLFGQMQLEWYEGDGKADGDAKKASAPFFTWLEDADAELDED